MNAAILELLTNPLEDDAASDERSTHAELVQKWSRRAAFLEAFALDCRDRNDLTTALVLEAVAQAHRSDARELHLRAVA
jgi:hypothetical protein